MLNKYIYKINKGKIMEEFPLTYNALFRFYGKSDIINFYEDIIGIKNPIIIDLIGTTGAGKTTFGQQFVGVDGKELLEKTITNSGNSTIIQTDIAILEDTRNRLFLKARNKNEIIRDMILVALNIDTQHKFDTRKNITDVCNKKGIRKDSAKEIKVESDIFQGIYNLLRRDSLIKRFQKIAAEFQKGLGSEDNIQKCINDGVSCSSLIDFLDNIIEEELGIDGFYGYRHEFDLDDDYILEKTIIPTKTFNKLKEQNSGFNDIISYRILFEQAILVLKCDDDAKKILPPRFKKGIIFRDSQGHKESEQVGIATDFEVKNKILLIPSATSGELVDKKHIEELKNIIISEPKQNIVVITKIDKSSSYEDYLNKNYAGFIESLKEQVVTTHNNLIGEYEQEAGNNREEDYRLDQNAIVRMFVESFDNAYLSKVNKDQNGKFDAELHKIWCEDRCDQEISTSDIGDIEIKESWYEVILDILDNESEVSYYEGGVKLRSAANKNNVSQVISTLAANAARMLDVCIKNIKWQDELNEALGMYSMDFRLIYNECDMWYNRLMMRDVGVSGYIKDNPAAVVKYFKSLVIKESNDNAALVLLESVLYKYLQDTYTFSERLDASKISKRIIENAIGRAVMASYKIYDRDIIYNNAEDNVEAIYDSHIFTKPGKRITQYDVYKRAYYTDTAYILGIYCNLLAKFKYNLETHFIDFFKAVLESELREMEK